MTKNNFLVMMQIFVYYPTVCEGGGMKLERQNKSRRNPILKKENMTSLLIFKNPIVSHSMFIHVNHTIR